MAVTAGAIKAGRAFVELFTEDSKLVRGLRRAHQRVQQWGASVRRVGMQVAGMGALIAAPLIGAAKVFASTGDNVAKMARRTGVSVEALSALSFAATRSGTSLEALENGLRRMQRTIYDAGRGLSTAVDGLADLGMTVKDLDGLSPEEQFSKIAEAISKIGDPTKRAALAMVLFGRSGTALLPMFENGAAGLAAFADAAKRLGLIISTEDATAAEQLTDALGDLWASVKMIAFAVGASLAPLLQTVAERLTRVTAWVIEWTRRNRQVFVTILKVAAAVVAVGVALIALSVLITGIGFVMGALISVVTTIGAAFSAIGSILALLLTPIGAVIAAVVALGAYLIYASGLGGNAVAWLGEKFDSLSEIAGKAITGIANALKAGNLELAAQIAWDGIQLGWLELTRELRNGLAAFRASFLIGWAEFAKNVVNIWATMVAGLRTLWGQFDTYRKTSGENAAAHVMRTYTRVRGWLNKEYPVEDEMKAIEAGRVAAITRIKGESDATIIKIAADLDKALLAAQERRDKAVADANKGQADAENALIQRIEDARKRLAASVAAAKVEADDMAAPAPMRKIDWDAILGGLGETISEQAEKIGVRGTFNAAALLGLQSGGPADRLANRTAIATERTAINTERMRDELESLQMEFG